MSIDKLKILSTKYTPEIDFSPEGTIMIKGRSTRENLEGFFSLLNEWVDKYTCDPAETTCVDLYFEYISTSALLFYISLLKRIKSIRLQNKRLIVNWHYYKGDEDILEKGEDISSTLNILINLIEIPD